MRIPGDFPEKPIGIPKVAGVASPARFFGLLLKFGSGCYGLTHDLIDGFARLHVMGKGEPSKSGTRGFDLCILSQFASRIE